MEENVRVIKVVFSKLGPILRTQSISVLDSSGAGPVLNDGESRVAEDLDFAYVYLGVSHFPSGELRERMNSNALNWRRAAQMAYRAEHRDQNIVFQDTP